MQEGRVWILISKKNNGDITEEELNELGELLRNEGTMAFSKEVIDELWHTPMEFTFREEPDMDKILSRIEDHLPRTGVVRSSRTFFTRKKLLVACLMASTVILAYLLFEEFNRNHVQQGVKDANLVSTQQGSRSKVILPDGTKVWLNSGSRISYGNFNRSALREVSLSGEAYFEIVHNEERPFIIHANQIDVRDIGTSFQVKAYPGDKMVEATVISGLIEITNHGDSERKIFLKAGEMISIPLVDSPVGRTRPLQDSITGLYTISKIKKDSLEKLPQTAWVQKKLAFDNEPFDSLALRMGKWYNVNIRIGDESLKHIKFSGTIENETIEQALNAMRFSYPFQFRIVNDEIWIDK